MIKASAQPLTTNANNDLSILRSHSESVSMGIEPQKDVVLITTFCVFTWLQCAVMFAVAVAHTHASEVYTTSLPPRTSSPVLSPVWHPSCAKLPDDFECLEDLI
jgi:hypothetical protein